MCGQDFARISGVRSSLRSTLAPSADAQTTGIREVSASPRSLIPLQTRLRYTTMIVLPDGRGDPGRHLRRSRLLGDQRDAQHCACQAGEGRRGDESEPCDGSGSVYSFLLSEKNGSGVRTSRCTSRRDPNAPREKPKYYSAAQVEALEAEVRDARAAVDTAARRADEAIAAYQQEYPGRLQFVYGTLKYEKPFLVRSIWHDGQFTYIKADASELPALYEVKDGKPSLRELSGAAGHVRRAEGSGRRATWRSGRSASPLRSGR